MSYDYYANQNNEPYDPWDQGVYRTGSTKPPKNRSGLIAFLLVTVILLCGVVSVLGIMNIRLFKQINAQNNTNTLPIMFSAPQETDSALSDEAHNAVSPTVTSETQQGTISSAESPVSVDNTPNGEGLSLQRIYEQNIQSVVSISARYSNGTSTGTGIILSEDGYIVTNCHVVQNANVISVLLTDGRVVDALLIGTDSTTDLAVLQITAEDLIPAQIGDSSVLRVGDTVVAIGDPLGIELRGTMTDGIVSAINRDMDVNGRVMSLIQTNAALNSGNSGGPLINCYGQVVGINTMKIGDSMSNAGVEGLGFAIPSATVIEIVNQLIEQGYVSGRPELGIVGEGVSEFYHFYYNFPMGLYITDVLDGSSAEEVGLAPGDILISIDGTHITSAEALRSLLYNYEPGNTLQAIVYRGGVQYSVTLTVGEAKS